MQSTRDQILQLANRYILEKGFNAFSFHDLARELGIKTASVHYHFPTKTALGVALVRDYTHQVNTLREQTQSLPPAEQLKAYLSIYTRHHADHRVCVVGSLAPDLYTLDPSMAVELKKLAEIILEWVTAILEEGRAAAVFQFPELPRTRALLLVTNMLASLPLTRLTTPQDFDILQQAIVQGLQPASSSNR